jgi:hypothetical protein
MRAIIFNAIKPFIIQLLIAEIATAKTEIIQEVGLLLSKNSVTATVVTTTPAVSGK